MRKVMTPSEIKYATDKQINKAVDQYRAMLQKHQSEWPFNAFQVAVLGSSDYVGDQLGMIRKRVNEMNNIVFITVISDGTTSQQWIKRLEAKGYTVAKQVLRLPEFKPTSGVTYRVAIFKGSMFSNAERVTSKIRAKVAGMGFGIPNVEVAWLIRDTLSNDDIATMGLYDVIVMHEPIAHSSLLGACRRDDGSDLCAYYGFSSLNWRDGHGFAFLAPQQVVLWT